MRNKVLIILTIILSSNIYAGDGRPINIQTQGGGGFFDMLGLDALGKVFFGFAAFFALCTAIKAIANGKGMREAGIRLIISLILIGIITGLN